MEKGNNSSNYITGLLLNTYKHIRGVLMTEYHS